MVILRTSLTISTSSPILAVSLLPWLLVMACELWKLSLAVSKPLESSFVEWLLRQQQLLNTTSLSADNCSPLVGCRADYPPECSQNLATYQLKDNNFSVEDD